MDAILAPSGMSPELWRDGVTAFTAFTAEGAVTLGLLLSSTVVREGSGQLVLREVEDRDLSVLFEHSTDRDAIRMAAFTSPDPDDRSKFDRRWARLKSDGSTTNRSSRSTVESWVTNWIGREDWGRGLATRALQEFLQVEAKPAALRSRRERQRRVDSCADEARFSQRGRGARVRPWAQRGD
jgi:hypothetical protein